MSYKRSDYPKSSARSPSEHLHEMTVQEMDRFPQLDYRQALARVMTRHPTIVRLHAVETNGAVRVVPMADFEGRYADPSRVIDLQAKSLMDEGRCKTYQQAVIRVLQEFPKLAARYTEWQSNPANREQPAPKINIMTQKQAKMIVKAHHERVAREGLCTYD